MRGRGYTTPPASPTDYARVVACLAKDQLFADLDLITSQTLSTQSSDGIELDHVVLTSPQFFAGGVYEFTVSASSACNLHVRVFPSWEDETNSSTGSFDNLCPPQSTGVRGWWPSAELLVHKAFTVRQRIEPEQPLEPMAPLSLCARYGICQDGAKDQSAFAWQGSVIDPYGGPPSGTSQSSFWGNKGLYGVNCRYETTFTKAASVTGDMSIVGIFTSRNTAGSYAGAYAVNVEDPTNSQVQGMMPNLRYNPNRDALSPTNGNGGPQLVLTNAFPTQKYSFKLANGGGAQLPIDIQFHTQSGIAPSGGGGD